MKDLKSQLAGALIVTLTMAALICAGINFQQQKLFRLPQDGVTWVDRGGSVTAYHVDARGQGFKAGIHTGDVLKRINLLPIQTASEVTQALVRLGAWSKPDYHLVRDNREFKYTVFVGERTPPTAYYYLYLIGAFYLFVGLFVFFRRSGAYKAVHFYLLCLASFVLYTFHYTGKLNNFDRVIFWGNVIAGLVAPTLFLHFCLTFPEPKRWLRGFWRPAAMYLPAALLSALYFGFASGTIRIAAPLMAVLWTLDRSWLVFQCAAYLAGGLFLFREYRVNEDPIVRPQLKWLRNGVFLGITPFALFYALPYAAGMIPNAYMETAVFSLALVPLTWAYAIIRYRLMDVDIIFQQGYVYTLATLAVIGIFYGFVFAFEKVDDLSSAALVSLILISTFIFQPIRNWIQEILDRYYFYKGRYDYRRTLIEFARELGSQTDLNRMLNSVSERLIHTLSLQQVAFFLSSDNGETFRLHLTSGRNTPIGDNLDLSFLAESFQRGSATPYLFFERTRYSFDAYWRDWPIPVRDTIADLALTYYVPCVSHGRTIAWLGVSRTVKGDFLSSDDVELLLTLSGYVGIAIENSRLYRSLERKVEEYERLKEFSENIVESINVGILAVDFEDRVEAWNTQIERLTGISREDATGRRLRDLFPVPLCEEIEQHRADTGVHNIYGFQLEPLPYAAAHANGHSNGTGHANGNGFDRRAAVLNLAVAPLISRDNEQIGRLIIFDDITDRHELERRLVQADKLSSIGILAAGVAHEVNTPLAVISTYSQMLAKQVSGDEQKSKILEKIAKQTFRASEIVNSLLNFSRTSSSEFGEVDINKIIRETLSLIEPQLVKARISATADLDDGGPLVRGNVGKLQQVFLNLCLNSRDAMDGGGKLLVRTRVEGGEVAVEVLDTGQGIAPEVLPRIFDPFFTTKPAKKGTGLGLSVTYGIVKEHSGSIEVESRQGGGACFHLRFPLAKKAVNV